MYIPTNNGECKNKLFPSRERLAQEKKSFVILAN